MYFTFQKLEDDFVFTDICPELLNLIFQKRDDLVGKLVDTALHIGDKITRKKLKQLYTLAWNQKKVVFYYFPDKNPDVFIITYLESQKDYNQTTKVMGRCIAIYKRDLQYPLQHAEQVLAL
ncbi:hypothetical protein P4G85_06235 [Bacillus cereus]|uniref:Uncharacterized protein n=2 Tax=Bacillus cereus group TaxID=86661 RepID=A0A9W5KQZ1_BACCE|nr:MULTISPECIES: hypothetical protein [Bacillus cereus group]MEB8734602.1 hypothetical protein [Bacillus cereus]EEM44709.1 hypothetical protein bthur0005_54780 [Bacillus thuringiensis serovar pakistani str. T13001]EJR60527.1 hypothetical protein IK5_06178 [Bacillus cereus VD154]KIU72970.1 hypothetical protein C797_20455 [Bacillus thuringiensis Sbt003]MEB8747972.1 hypothetical protein [Bacillus cereus]